MRTRPDRPWGPPSLLYYEYRVFPGGRGVNHPPSFLPRLKKEKSYTSAPLLVFVACSRVTFTFTHVQQILLFFFRLSQEEEEEEEG